MLQIRNLTIIYDKDQRKLVDKLSLTLNDGDRLAIIGEEGNGKSTLLQWIHDPMLIRSYATAQGAITKDGSTGLLRQMLPEEYHAISVYDYLSQNEDFLLMDYKELGALCSSMRLPIEQCYSMQRMDTLSGGERVKIQILSLMIRQPDVLLLDEPANDLDIATLEWLQDFLAKTPQPVIFISHDEDLLEHSASRILHIELLKRKSSSRCTLANMGYKEYLQQRKTSFARQARQAAEDVRQDQIRMDKLRKIEQTVEHDLRNVSRQDPHGGYLLKKKMHAVKSMEKRFAKERLNMREFPLQEEAIAFSFQPCNLPPGKIILDLQEETIPFSSARISLLVTSKEKVTIIGDNGIGKTTLLKQILKILSDRDDIKVGYMPQNYDDNLDLSLSPIAFLSPQGDKETVTKARQYLGAMRYTSDEMEHAMSQLSGGQKAKVLLLKMNLDECNVLLLDEPTRNLSPLSAPIIRSMLAAYTGCIIAVSHDRRYIKEVSTSVYILDQEKLSQAK